MTSQLELPGVRRYVRVECCGIDGRTGEPRAWHHVVDAHDAERVAREIVARDPGVRAEVRT